MPPEFAGFTSTMRLLWPVAVSTIATVPVLAAARAADGRHGRALARRPRPSCWPHCVWWVRRRDDWRRRWRAFLDAGRRGDVSRRDHGPRRAPELSKSYGDAPAVGPLDLDVAAGERVVLLGHNGSGKTTLLRMAAGLLEPSTGAITVFGQPVGSLEARAATSYLGDQPVFYDDLSVCEHLEYLARLHGTRRLGAARRRPARHRSASPSAADDLPTTFSRGLRQKAAIAARLRPAVRAAARRRAVRRPRPAPAATRCSSCSAAPTATAPRCSSRPTS